MAKPVGKRSGYKVLQTPAEETNEYAAEQSFTPSQMMSQGGGFAQPSRRGGSVRSKFFKMNEISYTPVQESQG